MEGKLVRSEKGPGLEPWAQEQAWCCDFDLNTNSLSSREITTVMTPVNSTLIPLLTSSHGDSGFSMGLSWASQMPSNTMWEALKSACVLRLAFWESCLHVRSHLTHLTVDTSLLMCEDELAPEEMVAEYVQEHEPQKKH